MKSNPVGWFEIYVQDMPRAKVFYEAVFQGALEELKNPDPNSFTDMEMWAFPMSMEGAGAAGALVKMAGCPSGGSTLVYFSCEDCSAVRAPGPSCETRLPASFLRAALALACQRLCGRHDTPWRVCADRRLGPPENLAARRGKELLHRLDRG